MSMLGHLVGAAKKRSFVHDQYPISWNPLQRLHFPLINIYDYRIQLNVYAIRKPVSARKK